MQKTLVAVLVDTAHVEHPDHIALDDAPMLTSSQLTVDRSTLEKLRNHAASAAHRVGHLHDVITAGPLAEQVSAIGDDVDTIAHELDEILGEACTLAERDAAAPDVAHGAPMLALGAGGAP